MDVDRQRTRVADQDEVERLLQNRQRAIMIRIEKKNGVKYGSHPGLQKLGSALATIRPM